MTDLPRSVLFACNLNAVRSPMAAALLRHLHGRRIYVDSVGVRAGEVDAFAEAVMDEIGLTLDDERAGRRLVHRTKGFADLEDTSFDVVISLTPEAHHQALELTRTHAIEAEYWPTLDPTAIQGSREQILDAYRAVRDGLKARILARFPRVNARD
jgi:protein-tyrosine-phosphatase